ncbi:VCBS repeat-containing protein [Flexithrix dorotheae]|uniref:VCBS repeat-containing protein n=1 Tax=Flexithrix dorotheae TaxID=70993 RepID=UPI0003828D90|nr:VCBS repeat-containing protein [Flexithrix dorotheae]
MFQKLLFQITGFILLLLLVQQCNTGEDAPPEELPKLFSLLPEDQTNITFNNKLEEGLNTNVMMYEYFYNGAGVAAGDLNNDGLEDLVFSGNMVDNAVYLNQGDFKFKDITEISRVKGRKGGWKTGVTLADVNGDGWLDIYLCYSGNVKPASRTNELYINQGVNKDGIPLFEEKARIYGLNSPATSTQASFFDFDKDGDLDMFLLNHSPFPLPVLDETTTGEHMEKDDPVYGSRLFENITTPDGQHRFMDITPKAGIVSASLSYGLGIGIADFNNDGWQDIYVGNDYSIPDYLYFNNQDGTFTNKLQEVFGHTSHFSMGNDIADVNNDGLVDLYTLDMLPEDNRRQKLLFAPDNYELFNLNLKVGFHYQYMRNMLQMNNGNLNESRPIFSEVGQMAGISNTDWSWSALFADYNNDGWKDLLVTNGYVRDYTNMDFLKYMGNFTSSKQGKLVRKDILELVHKMPASNVSNYIYQNNADLTFENKQKEWGLDATASSTGATYADLDNDGDLDLVINNINKSAFVYQNKTIETSESHYLKIKLKGEGKNTFGLGAKVTIYSNGQQQYLEQMPTRGYQSSVSPVLHFGLGENNKIDSVKIAWLNGKTQVLQKVKPDQTLVLEEGNAQSIEKTFKNNKPVFRTNNSPVSFAHQKNNINDFKRQPLMVNPLSFDGPCMVKGDVNGDGLEDVFVGGSVGQESQLFIQAVGGKFRKDNSGVFADSKGSEDVNALFFDANGDGHQDLYVCSGGYGNFSPEDKALQDRLYLNKGNGTFEKDENSLPIMLTSSSCVSAADIDQDGSPDLFVGSKVIPGAFPEIPVSYILLNNGKGKFEIKTPEIAPSLENPGLISDAVWVDLDGDETEELIIAGEWMPIQVYSNEQGKLVENTTQFFDKEYSGWWNKLLVDDLNKDGRPDLVVGNFGLNSQCKVSDREPADLYYKDFDNNGAVDPIFCFYIQGKSYPSVTRDELLGQITKLRSKFPNYKSYADAQIHDIFSEEDMKGVKHLAINELKTVYFQSQPNGKFQFVELPEQVQYSPVHTITSLDYNLDGIKDLLLCGNTSKAKLRFGKNDANYGILLRGNKNGNFSYVPQTESGFNISGDVRSVLKLDNILLFGINQSEIKAYTNTSISSDQKLVIK